MNTTLKADVCVVGGGSGGFAAALRAAQAGCRTVLIEKERLLGGNSTVCGVNCWEPVAGAAYGLPRELYDRMRQVPGGCGVYRNAMHYCLKDPARNDFPGGLYRIDPSLDYDDTLKQGFPYGCSFPEIMNYWHGVIFEPRVLDRCVRQMLREAGCRIITGHACAETESRDGHISSIRLDDGRRITAKIWIDNCGVLAASAGCRLFMGQEAKSQYDEPDAPDRPGIATLNGVTLIFRVTPAGNTKKIFPGCTPRRASMVATEYPNGDYNCNMLPTMAGREFFAMDRESSMREMQRRVRDFWCYVQTNFPWGRNYRLKSICVRPGIRESFRIQCRYMLNENDLLAGLKSQKHPDLTVIADHHMDLHGAKNPGRIVQPYGIPYRSLLPEGTDNLLVAGRIGGFSCLAASSCRLSRTIIRLGEAAGYAAALALRNKCPLRSVDIRQLQNLMHFEEEKQLLSESAMMQPATSRAGSIDNEP